MSRECKRDREGCDDRLDLGVSRKVMLLRELTFRDIETSPV